MVIKTVCPVCSAEKEIYTPTKNHVDWKNGALIQNAMPWLNADDRERLISGICPECYNKMFGEEEK